MDELKRCAAVINYGTVCGQAEEQGHQASYTRQESNINVMSKGSEFQCRCAASFLNFFRMPTIHPIMLHWPILVLFLWASIYESSKVTTWKINGLCHREASVNCQTLSRLNQNMFGSVALTKLFRNACNDTLPQRHSQPSDSTSNLFAADCVTIIIT